MYQIYNPSILKVPGGYLYSFRQTLIPGMVEPGNSRYDVLADSMLVKMSERDIPKSEDGTISITRNRNKMDVLPVDLKEFDIISPDKESFI